VGDCDYKLAAPRNGFFIIRRGTNQLIMGNIIHIPRGRKILPPPLKLSRCE